jgi:hypothetical protein
LFLFFHHHQPNLTPRQNLSVVTIRHKYRKLLKTVAKIKIASQNQLQFNLEFPIRDSQMAEIFKDEKVRG